MKTKFLLTLLTLNGLFWGVNCVSASATSQTESHRTLSHTIAKLIDVDAHNLVELAIDRALIAQQVNDNKMPNPVTAGVPSVDVGLANKQHPVRGRVAKPKIGQVTNPGTNKKSDLPQSQPSSESITNRQHPAGGIEKKQKD
jgi:hypothetical protein